ncbi:carbamate kinase [Haemophilus influenzae 3655]|uniref:Carbamate kinase n=1 Tax=Haemophilus influenzae (strain NTHi 3655) TaxID=375177 RepID=A0A0H3PCA3_HAEI3|nr:hypothetical protein [Haemophilus influenzae]EDJ91998.1 carbamate kinase [Haemophilus influenzae 3655]
MTNFRLNVLAYSRMLGLTARVAYADSTQPIQPTNQLTHPTNQPTNRPTQQPTKPTGNQEFFLTI